MLATNEKEQNVQTTQQAQQQAQQPVQQNEPKVDAVAAPSVQQQKQVSSGYNKAMQTLKAAENTAPAFSSDYDQTISDLYEKITSREPFKYDYSTDPLYGQYREQYTQLGKQAARDTMGQAAALTGGYGSSYGQAVGQQQYDAYLQRLNDVLPDLYKTAYDMYNAEGDKLTQQLQLAGNLRNQEYSQFRDAVSDKQYADAFAIQQAESRAQYGDFSGYEALYGKDAAKDMALAWAAANPDAAYAAGTITPEEYYTLTGRNPHVRGTGGGGSSGGVWAGNIKYAWLHPESASSSAGSKESTKLSAQYNK